MKQKSEIAFKWVARTEAVFSEGRVQKNVIPSGNIFKFSVRQLHVSYKETDGEALFFGVEINQDGNCDFAFLQGHFCFESDFAFKITKKG